MKHLLLFLTCFLYLQQTIAQYTQVPDSNFEQALIDLGIDSEGTLDGQFLTADGQGVLGLFVDNRNISDLTGVEAFVDLLQLSAYGNNLTSINLSLLPLSIYDLFLGNNNLITIDLSPLPNLINLSLIHNDFTSVTVPSLSNLFALYLGACPQLTDVTIYNCPNLQNIGIQETLVLSIDLSNAPILRNFSAYESQIQTLDFTNNQNLEEVYASNSPLASINLPNNPNLEILDVDACQLTQLDITNCPGLWYVSCGTNLLNDLDLTGNPLLEELRCWENQLSSLDLSQNPNINYISCFDNQLTNINLTNTFNLDTLGCHLNPLEELINITDCQNLRTLYSPNTLLGELDLSQNPILYNVTLGDNPNLEMVNIKNGNNTGMSSFTVFNCPNLSCVVVDDPLANNDNILFGPNTNATLVSSVEECNLSITENELQQIITVYPNPASTILNINTNNIEIIKIELYDVLGKKVLGKNGTINQLDISNLDNGLYLVNIQTAQGVLVKKILKQ